MNYKYFIAAVAFIYLITLCTTGPGCANIVPPQGGPRDSLPPVLIKADPGDSSRNFKGNKITFTFDEYIELQNAFQQVLISPTPKTMPQIDSRLKEITVKLKDSLEANTTYSINFGEAIKDFAEGNVLKEFTYIFSTGPFIDSLELSGKVLLAENGAADTTLIVMLHKNGNDSAVVNEKPRYIARLDRTGTFRFKNLPPGTFYMYALKAEGGSTRYNDNKQLFAFADKPVNTADNNDSILLYAFAEKKEAAQTITAPQARRGGIRNEGGDNRLKLQTNLAPNNLLELQQDLIISFELPLTTFDSAKLKLTTDSTYTPVNNYSFVKDSTGKKIQVKYAWEENTAYHLIVDKEFASDTSGRKLLKTDTLDFMTKKKEDYGGVNLRFRNLDLSKNPVLFFIQNNEIKKSFPLTSADFAQNLFVPGEYQLSILNDDNKNGKWDPGDFFGKRRQPEIVKPIDRKITVKAGQENEVEIAL